MIVPSTVTKTTVRIRIHTMPAQETGFPFLLKRRITSTMVRLQITHKKFVFVSKSEANRWPRKAAMQPAAGP